MLAPNLAATILTAQIQEHERAVGGWHTEWITFPALALVTSGTLSAIADIAEGLEVDIKRMKANLEISGGLIMAYNMWRTVRGEPEAAADAARHAVAA